MGRIECLTGFFAAIENDGRISPTHISVFAALLKYRVDKLFVNPVSAFSRDILAIAKISSPYTYHKCVKELSNYGYIKYEPSFKKTQASKIYFLE